MTSMSRIILESPFAGDLERNAQYLRDCITDCVRRGESCYPSHKIYPGALDDNNPAERVLGIGAGYAWWGAASKIVFYIDYGYSHGMKLARQRAERLQMHIEERKILNVA